MKRAILVSAVIFVLLLGVSRAGSALDVWYVDSIHGIAPGFPLPDGWGHSWNNAYKTIQQALENAESNDEIWVRAGSYQISGGPITVQKPVKIYGGFPPGEDIGWGDRNWEIYKTTIEPRNRNNTPNHLLWITANATLDGFDICKGGDYQNDGGAIYNQNTNPTIRNCTFNGNQNIAGGAIYNENANPYITACKFIRNRADYGGAIFNSNSNPLISDCEFLSNFAWAHGGAIAEEESQDDQSVVRCENSTFRANTAPMGGAIWELYGTGGEYINCIFQENSAVENQPFDAMGGAIYSERTNGLSVTSCNFNDNHSEILGGAVFGFATSNLNITTCTFSSNTSGLLGYGGAILLEDQSASTVSGCYFYNNVNLGSSGGAIRASGDVVIRDSRFVSNEAVEQGGAISIAQSAYNSGYPTFENCAFEDNEADSGGAIFVDTVKSRINRCVFLNNIASMGGAIYSSDIQNNYKPLFLSNSIFYGNSSVNGGALYAFNTYTEIDHCTFTGNRSEESGAVFFNYNRTTGLNDRIVNSILWGNLASADYFEQKEITYSGSYTPPYLYNCNIEQNWDAELSRNVIRQDPLFVDPNGDFRIRAGSPCINAAEEISWFLPPPLYEEVIISPVPNLDKDFEGDPRIAGSLPDMGADEVLLKVDVDIMPKICPNRPTVADGAILPVAILGTRNFNVNAIDPETVRLKHMELEIAPSNDGNFRRVSKPVHNRQVACDCTTGSDRYNDLLLEFDIENINWADEYFTDKDRLVLTITGELNDGTPFIGKDCLDISEVKQ